MTNFHITSFSSQMAFCSSLIGFDMSLLCRNNEAVYVKWHFKTNQGIKNLTGARAAELEGKDPDYAIRDLFNAIAEKQFPSWTFFIQVTRTGWPVSLLSCMHQTGALTVTVRAHVRRGCGQSG